MKFPNALFVLRVTAFVMAVPTESANGDIVVTPCNWNKKCFIICNDESGLVAAVTDGICPSLCGIDWSSGMVYAESIDPYYVDSTLAFESTAEGLVKRELDVGAHADWKDTLDMGAHVDWNNKEDTKADV